MRLDNVIITAVGVLAVGLAVAMSWRWRGLCLRTEPGEAPARTTAAAAASDAVRTVACILAAGFCAGFLVPGLGGRLLMRVLGATSGDSAQGRLTEAGEVVGEITFSGTLSLIIFVGLLVPLVASFIYLAIRPILPNRAWVGGAVFGIVLLASFGVDDPLSPDNVDFRILTPLPLAVALVVLTAILFGTTFVALAARLDQVLPPIGATRGRQRAVYASLLVVPLPFIFVPSAVYVTGRTAARGRLRRYIELPAVRVAGQVLVAGAVLFSVVTVVRTAADIL